MVWRETGHFLQARSRVNSSERRASVACALRQACTAYGMDARDMAGKCSRPPEV
jgi:hypothetical protein